MRPAMRPAIGPPAPPEAPAISVASAAWMGFWAGDDVVGGAGGVECPLVGRVGGRGSLCSPAAPRSPKDKGSCGGDGEEVVVTAAVETVGGDLDEVVVEFIIGCGGGGEEWLFLAGLDSGEGLDGGGG